MHSRAREIIRQGDSLFSQKRVLDSLWQEVSLHFYPERADFTTERSLGEEFAGNLFSSYPVMARRELANLFSANLRPRNRPWFEIHVEDEDIDNGSEERKFLEHLSKVQWRAMYDPPAQFIRATRESDHDFATFGNAVLQHSTNVARDGLFYANYHLRDCAWMEGATGKPDCLHRNWETEASRLVHYFGDKVSSEVKKAYEKEPSKKFKCRHVVMPSRLYQCGGKSGGKHPYTSLYVELESETILEEIGVSYFCYVVPRWQTVSGSQYGTSMATSVLLPDARTLQIVMRTLREAGEKFVDPPMIAISEAIRGDIALYPGGVTTADVEYDERLGEVLRPVTQDRGGMPIGFDIATALKEDIRNGFMLDKIQLPEAGKNMTAFEVRRRLDEHVRQSSPIFEPIINDYNDPICEGTFKILLEHGAFPVDQMPDSLRGRDVMYKFRSPLADMTEHNESQMFMDIMSTMVAPIAQMDPSQLENVELTDAMRDAMRAAGWKAKWFKPKEAVEARQAAMAEQAEQAQAMQEAGSVADLVQRGGKGAESIAKAGAPALGG